jgi:hypothetical protein
MSQPAAPARVIEETPAYWRVVFDYPPFNIADATALHSARPLGQRVPCLARHRLLLSLDIGRPRNERPCGCSA